MSDENLVQIEPFAVRPKEAARLDGCGITEFYARLNRVGASSVYLTVCWMFLCPRYACSDRVSRPAFAW